MSLRQEARKTRIITNVKPFTGTMRVTNPVRGSRASSRKRALRGGGATLLAKRDSEIKRCASDPEFVEVGEWTFRTPWSEEGCRVVDGELEPRRGRRASPACQRETTRSCEGRR